jgi:nucleotide-binding universal stress UspA family protein
MAMSDPVTNSGPVIVVGVDGSDASKDALRWAARQAELTGATLRAIMTWNVPMINYGAAMPGSIEADVNRDSKEALDQAIQEVLGPAPSARVAPEVVEGHPAEVLVGAAGDAELLVVGSRGHGAFKGMFLGSVSTHCVSHATCPVVVVRHQPET